MAINRAPLAHEADELNIALTCKMRQCLQWGVRFSVN